MTQSAHNSIFSVSFGQAAVRGLYFEGSELHSAVAVSERGNPVNGLAVVTKMIEENLDRKISPAEVIISGTKETLDLLDGRVKADLVPEEKAITSAEGHLTKALLGPAAVLDLGPSAFFDRAPSEEIGRWLPFSANLTDIENYLANKRLYPRIIPVTEHEYEIDLAVARQAIIKLGQKEGKEYLPVSTKLNLVLTGGLLTAIPATNDLISVLLDSFYFKSGVTIYLDAKNELIPAGAIFSKYEAAEIPLSSRLRKLGSILHLGGNHEFTIDFGTQSKQRLVLQPGEIATLPSGGEHELEISVDSGKSRHEYKLFGGEGGVYLDNRERPLGLVAGSKDSIGKILTWRKLLSGERLFSEVK
jgi:hypothetical protein